MKKLLLLSVLSFSIIIQSNDKNDFYEINSAEDLNNFANVLKNFTSEDIKKDIDRGEFESPSRKISVTCQSILNALDMGMNKELLQRFALPCNAFYVNVAIAISQSSLPLERKHTIMNDISELIRKSHQLSKQ